MGRKALMLVSVTPAAVTLSATAAMVGVAGTSRFVNSASVHLSSSAIEWLVDQGITRDHDTSENERFCPDERPLDTPTRTEHVKSRDCSQNPWEGEPIADRSTSVGRLLEASQQPRPAEPIYVSSPPRPDYEVSRGNRPHPSDDAWRTS